jgi:hypothetical protein
VGDGVFGINPYWDSSVLNEIRRRILLRSLRLVQNHFDINAAFVGVNQSFGNGNRRKGVGLNENRLLGRAQFSDNGFSAATLGREVNVNRGRRRCRTSPFFGKAVTMVVVGPTC